MPLHSRLIKDALEEIDCIRVFSLINTVSFLGLGITEFNFASDARLLENEKRSLYYSAALLGIAGSHYAALEVSRPSIPSEIVVRYSDWLLTTPLLLLSAGAYYKVDVRLAVLFDIAMVAIGFVYEETGNRIFWTISSAFYVLLLVHLWQTLPDKSFFYRYFLAGWAGYGFISLVPPQSRLLPFNFLDFYNKFVFAVELRTKIKRDIEAREAATLSKNE